MSAPMCMQPMIEFGDLVEIRSSLVDPLHPDNSCLPHVGPEHIESGSGNIKWQNVRSCAEDGVTSGKYLFHSGDIVYSKIRPYLNKVAIADRTGLCSADMYAIVARPSCDANFIYRYLQTPDFLTYAASLSGRANIPKINRQQLAGSQLPLPPLDEQRRIAAILDKADALRRKRKRALELLDGLIDSFFVSMFGDPRAAEGRWDLADFSESCSDRTAAGGKIQKSEYAASGLFPVVDQGQSFIAGRSNQEKQVRRLSSPVVIFGDHTRIVKYVDFDFIVGADGAKVLHPTDRFNPLFFAELMRRMPIPDLGYSRHMRALKELQFVCPPMNVQIRFSDFVVKISNHKNEAQRGLKRLDALFASLEHRAFAGKP